MERILKNCKALVTGGAGFIGSNLIESLLDAGNNVVCLDNFSTGKRKNLAGFKDNPNFSLIEGDIRNYDDCQKAVSNIEVVFHEAALGSVPRSIKDPVTSTDVNIGGFVKMLFAAKEAKVKRRPVSVMYKTVVPGFAQDGVHNFLNNLDGPVTFANDVLQGEMDRAGATMSRFVINSTVGVGGLIDVAGKVGIPGHHEDFGQTLAVWGVGEGAYLYTPVLGPSTSRDLAGSVVDLAFNPLTYLALNDNNNAEWVPYARMGAEAIDLRSRNMEALDNLKRTSVDFYVAIRSAYRQNRKFEINNGAPTDEDLPPIE